MDMRRIMQARQLGNSESVAEELRKAIAEELEKGLLYEGIAISAAEAPSLYMNVPLTKEDFDRFREEWEKAMHEAPGWAQIKPEPTKVHPLEARARFMGEHKRMIAPTKPPYFTKDSTK